MPATPTESTFELATIQRLQARVNRVLRKNHIRGDAFLFLQKRLMQQAEATYEEWPMAA